MNLRRSVQIAIVAVATANAALGASCSSRDGKPRVAPTGSGTARGAGNGFASAAGSGTDGNGTNSGSNGTAGGSSGSGDGNASTGGNASASGTGGDASRTGGTSGGSATTSTAGRLVPIARLGGTPALVEGARSVALRFVDRPGYYVAGRGRLVDIDQLSTAIAAQIEAFGGGLVDVHLGIGPIVSGGEEHHEKHVRIGTRSQTVEVEGLIAQVALVEYVELWRVEHEARRSIIIVDAKGRVTRAAPFARLAPDARTLSPVSAKLCKEPAVVDLASNGRTAVGLVLECNRDAPVRIATYRMPGPSITTTKLAAAPALGFLPEAIAISNMNDVALVGAHEGKLAIGRLDNLGKVSVALGASGITSVRDADLTDANELWTLAGQRVVREHEPIALTSPEGEAVAATNLAFDAQLGIVVLAQGARTSWLFAQRWNGAPLRLP